MASKVSRIVNQRTGSTVATEVQEAGNPWQAFKGLMFRKDLPDGHGMVFRPARGIHTQFMRFPIDLVFLDDAGKVVKIRPAMVPWRFDFTNADAVIELKAGVAGLARRSPRRPIALCRFLNRSRSNL